MRSRLLAFVALWLGALAGAASARADSCTAKVDIAITNNTPQTLQYVQQNDNDSIPHGFYSDCSGADNAAPPGSIAPGDTAYVYADNAWTNQVTGSVIYQAADGSGQATISFSTTDSDGTSSCASSGNAAWRYACDPFSYTFTPSKHLSAVALRTTADVGPPGCPGSGPPCPYTSTSLIGADALTEPQGIAIDPTGTVLYVTNGTFTMASLDFNSHYVQPSLPPADASGVGVLRDTGLVYAASSTAFSIEPPSTVVTELKPDGTVLNQFGSSGKGVGQISSAMGLAVDPTNDSVYVVDQGGGKIVKFMPNGTFVREIGSPGTNPSQLSGPWFAAVDPNSGNVFVTDAYDRVQEFGGDGTFIRQWATSGTGTTQNDAPRGIAVSDDGYVFVADSQSDRIQMFTTTGAPVASWGAAGTDPGEFQEPIGVAVVPGSQVIAVAGGGAGQVVLFNVVAIQAQVAAVAARVARDGTLAVDVRCRSIRRACAGRVVLDDGRLPVGAARFRVAAGRRARVRVRIDPKLRRRARLRRTRLYATTYTRQRDGRVARTSGKTMRIRA